MASPYKAEPFAAKSSYGVSRYSELVLSSPAAPLILIILVSTIICIPFLVAGVPAGAYDALAR
jgi:hypothetical protein